MEFSSPVKSNFLKVVSFGLGLYQFKRKTDHTQKKKNQIIGNLLEGIKYICRTFTCKRKSMKAVGKDLTGSRD